MRRLSPLSLLFLQEISSKQHRGRRRNSGVPAFGLLSAAVSFEDRDDKELTVRTCVIEITHVR